MNRPNLQSASGLRPATAFFSIAVVLLAVCGRAWVLSMEEDHSQPGRDQREEFLPTPDYNIVDREGLPLAQSVQRMDLALSPRSMWQAHTPELVAEAIVPLLGGSHDVQQLLKAFFPRSKQGVIRVRAKGWQLSFDQAKALEGWTRELGIQDELWSKCLQDRGCWEIHWRPMDLLSKQVREDAGWKGIRPLEWTRELADGIALALRPEPDGEASRQTFKQKEKRRVGVWKAMLPCADTVAIKGLPPEAVFELSQVLDAQVVADHQMSIRFEHERVYPTRQDQAGEDAFKLVGKWRFVNAAQATAMSIAEGVEPAKRASHVRRLLDRRHPVSGLEGMASSLLKDPSFDYIRTRPASYRYRRVVAVHQPTRRYFDRDQAEDETPRVVSTLDSKLQRYLLEQLGHTLEDNRAAAAMGIVIEVETGDVLAVGSTSSEDVFEFMPTWHKFSPGSTFKVVVMATALEAGVVTFGEEFDTHNGHYRVPGSRSRVIHEAQGAPTGVIPAWMGISKSVNAVLVQIGMRVPDTFFHEKLTALGYGKKRGAGIGTESAGRVPGLPWSHSQTHASISFGHELSVNLWQHTEALATIMRGGLQRPLRMLRRVNWEDQSAELALGGGERVFSADTCATVRTMMAEGARSGTGRHLSARENKLGTPIQLLSKTGTTEKEGGVACLHKELKRNALNSQLKGGSKHPDFISFKSLQGTPPVHKGSCYTSSICLVGRVAGEERELMVVIVVEEPRKGLRFGSDVAGPTAMAVLKDGLGLTRSGVCVVDNVSEVPDYGYENKAAVQDEPWRLRAVEAYVDSVATEFEESVR